MPLLLQHQSISTLPSFINSALACFNVTFIYAQIRRYYFDFSSHSSVILDEYYTETLESFKQPFSKLLKFK